MRRLLAFVCCLLFPVAGLASSFRIVYEGGASPQAGPGNQLRLYVDSNQLRIVSEKSAPANVSSAQTKTPHKNIHRQAGAALGLGGLEVGICSRKTIAATGENRRSITFGFSLAQPLFQNFDLRVLWFDTPGTFAKSTHPTTTGEIPRSWHLFPPNGSAKHSGPLRCLAPV